ncbi:MAG: SAM-dependent methyltransferase [Bradymonadia bacterium]
MTNDSTGHDQLERIYAEKRVSEDPVPLAAIFRTRRDRRQQVPAASADATEPDWLPPDDPEADTPVIEIAQIEGVDDPFASPITTTQEAEIFDADTLVVEDFIDVESPTQPEIQIKTPDDGAHPLRALIPADADPAWARDAILAIANKDAARLRTPSMGAWFAEMFTEEYLQSQPHRGEATNQSELRFLDWALRLRGQPARLLDLGCGIGRHAVGFAQTGHDVVGIDLSETMLAYAARLAEQAQCTVDLQQMDMRDLACEEEFDAAWCMNTTFGYFTDVENLMLLRALHRALRPAGRLVLDVLNRDHALQSLPTRNWWEGDGCLIQEDIEFDARHSRVEIRRYLVFADGRERVHDISIRLFSLHELVHLLTLAGFAVDSVSGSLHTPSAYFGGGSERLLVVARRLED